MMEKKTVIANIRAEIMLTEDLQKFFAQFQTRDNAWFAHEVGEPSEDLGHETSQEMEEAWFARDGGNSFLAEFGSSWNKSFTDVAQSVFDDYFRELGFSENRIPRVELTDSRRGSWIMEAALTMFGTVGTAYTILKGISELPKIADGLEETKKRLQKELTALFKKKIPEKLDSILSNTNGSNQLPPQARANPVSISCSIDARPIRGLTPDVAKSHAIHLAVAVSRSALSIENLGDTSIENLRIGIFKSATQKDHWYIADAFLKSVPRLSGKQSTSLAIDQFVSESNGVKLDLEEKCPLYVDCWLQDNTGIYLFNFFLE